MSSLREEILSSKGYYGEYGGSFIPEVIRPNIDQVVEAFDQMKNDPSFLKELDFAYRDFGGRPTNVMHLKNISEKLGGAQLYIKNEGRLHTGAHKINHCLGQIILAKRMGKKRIIAETGAGQHGLATATVCARFGMKATIYMGRIDYERQRPNVFWMEQLGSTVIPVDEGEKTLNDAIIAAFKDLIAHPQESHYLLGSALGPHPYPVMNTFFQKVIGEEIKEHFTTIGESLPKTWIACAGGGSNAMGMFFDALDEKDVKLIAVEAGGRGMGIGEHASKVTYGKVGVFEGFKSYFLQDNDGNISKTHSISAGLDYCGISPILAWLNDIKRVSFETAGDTETLDAVKLMIKEEGIIPALESSHGLAYAFKLAKTMPKEEKIVVNLSGRGEKDLFILFRNLQEDKYVKFLENELSTLPKTV
ncbi:MAG: tryptophan synthase beta chain [Sphingobacteriales bacterium]|jgi:tryptophan synthase beta chain